jgi:hypothetical protein
MNTSSRYRVQPLDKQPRWLYSPLFVPVALLGLTLAMFADVLFIPGDRILSGAGNDTYTYFLYQRQFGFEQLRAGHFPLWNPHIYSGAPFFGSFQTAMLYPPNWILYLTLPLAKAISYEFVLHVFLVGLFIALWAKRYSLHPMAALLAGCLAMFSLPYFERVVAGHEAPMDSMTWTPLVLLSVDSILDRPSAKWVLIGIFAVSMLILAGYPPILFTTIVSCAIYGAMRLIRAPRPGLTVLAVAIVGSGACLICAAQLWAGLQASGEGLRQHGLSLAISSSLSLSFDNILTLLVPDFFGGGALLIWGGVGGALFFGLTGLLIALFAVRVGFPHRGVWIATVLALLWIALGKHTPLFGLLYRFVPGFNLFRKPSEYCFEFVLFMAMMSAFGMDALIRSPVRAKNAGIAVLILGLALGAFGAIARAGTGGMFDTIWRDFFLAVVTSAEVFFPLTALENPSFIEAAKRFAGSQCLIAAAMCLVVAALLLLRLKRREAAYILAIVGIAEAMVYARPMVSTFDLNSTVPVAEKQFIAAHPGDYRIFNPTVVGVFALSTANSAVALGANDIWGYEPVVPKRYSEFVTFSQGGNPDDAADALFFPRLYPVTRMPQHRADQPVGFIKVPPMLHLVRLRYVFWGIDNGFFSSPGDLPHVLLVDGWQRLEHRNDILAALNAFTFDGRKTVILEQDPVPAPVAAPTPGSDPGTVQLLNVTTDSLTIEANVKRPMLLLITDSYSRYWRATALPGSSQREYQVMPADYTLMAIPLSAGKHLLQLEYAPSGWIVGRWISLASLLIYLAAVIWWLLNPRQTIGPSDALI